MIVVISGTSTGIGEAIAREFLSKGHIVYGFDVDLPSIEDRGYHHVIQDIRNPIENKLDADILINNAGTFSDDEAIDINLIGTINFTEHFIKSPSLKSVLFIASASARNGSELAKYAASKAGVVGYMKNIALNLSKRGIVANSISPGGVITKSNEHILRSAELYNAVKAETLLGKWAEPEEIAELAYFLSVTNRSITGEDILIDNGEMLKSNFIW